MKWSKEEIKYLRDYYTVSGLSYCNEKMNRTKIAIKNKVSKLGIKYRNKKLKLFNNINDDKISKEISYILGFLWSDGYIVEKNYTTKLSIIEEDAIEIKNIILFTDDWNIYEYSGKNRKQITYSLGNKDLYFY